MATHIRPQKAYVMEKAENAGLHSQVEGFDPELPKDLWWGGVANDDFRQSDGDAQKIMSASRLMLNTRDGVGGEQVAQVLRVDSNYFISRQIKTLFDEIEPGVHRYFAIRVASKVPIGGQTDHDTYYWLRPPPIIDCLLFPKTKTRADVQGAAWDKTPQFNSIGIPFRWGGGVAFSNTAHLDGTRIEGRHLWLTRQGPGKRFSTHLLTWSHALFQEYRRRQLGGWRIEHEFNINY